MSDGTKEIRKALQTALFGAKAAMRAIVPTEWLYGEPYDDGEFPIWWPNEAFYDGEGESLPPFYVRFSLHPAPDRVRTIGPTPRVWKRGYAMVTCYVPLGVGEDVADNLANAVAAAYPYATEVVRDGFEVHLAQATRQGAFAALGRWSTPVHIDYDCWRAT